MPPSSAMKRGVILSLVERGWQAARTYSLEHSGEHLRYLHIVKGRLPREVRGLIAPSPHLRLISVSRHLFWPAVVLWCLWYRMTGTLCGMLVDNERSYRRLQGWRPWESIEVLVVKFDGHRHTLWAGAVPVTHVAWER